MSEFVTGNNKAAQSANTKDTLTDAQKDRITEEILNDLAEDTEYASNSKCFEHAALFEDIYDSGAYTTKYSIIFETLCKYFKNREKSMEVLQLNLEKLCSVITEDSCEKNTFFGFSQFVDAVDLELGRYNFYTSELSSHKEESNCASGNEIVYIKERLKELESNAEISNSVTADAKKTIINIDDKLEKNSISSITALTIFSAVILAFSGGLTVFNGVFESMAQASPLRLVFTASILGFIMFNTIFMLLYIVSKMAGKGITKIGCYDNSCDNSFGHQNPICSLVHRYPYVFFVNAVFMLIFYYSTILYFALDKIFDFSCFSPTIFLTFVCLIPIIIIILLVFLSFQPFIYKTQQKRLYNEYKLRILSNLAIKATVPEFPHTKNLNLAVSGTFERSAEKDLISSLTNTLISSRNTKINIEKFLNNEIARTFSKFCLCGEKKHFISFSENRLNKQNIKCTLRTIKSYYK